MKEFKPKPIRDYKAEMIARKAAAEEKKKVDIPVEKKIVHSSEI